MEITEYGFDTSLKRGFEQIDNVIAVSGRCTHGIFYDFRHAGKTGNKINIENPEDLGFNKNIFYSGETCNRGPLMYDKNKIMKLNYYDERHYYLGNDDHDLMIRAYINNNYICGYIPISFKAPLSNGSTRNRNKLKMIIKKI